ncbi:Ig-like domain-containing protein, partial [Mycolicibacterium diernhoferi]|uniref:Ig-like domain-containing protein n=1 Tax=Mycolicibacterium diernhoferi TaxID=1801 RepID=UPI0013F61461
MKIDDAGTANEVADSKLSTSRVTLSVATPVSTVSTERVASDPVPEVSASIGTAKAEVVATVAAPSLAPGTGLPVQSPAEWVVLAAVRREIGDMDGDSSTPTVEDARGLALTATASAESAEGPARTAAPASAIGAPVRVGNGPWGITVAPNGTRVYVANSNDGTVSVINTATNSIVGAPIRVGLTPIGVAVSPDGSRVYVTNHDGDTLSVIDTATNQVVGAPISVGRGPVGVAVSPDGSRVYVANYYGGTVSVIDTATNKTLGAAIPLGEHPLGIAMSPNGTRIYVTNSYTDTVTVIDTVTNSAVGDPVLVGRYPSSVTVSPNGSRVYVTNQWDGTVSVIDTATNRTVGTPIPVGISPFGVTASLDGTRLYVTNIGDGDGSGNGTLSVIDTATNAAVGAPVALGTDLYAVALSPNGTRAYVTNYTTGTVSVIDTGITAYALVGKPNVKTGVVLGTVTITNPGNQKLVYTASVPAKGKVSVNSSGAFTYTPSAAARHAASVSGAGAAVLTDTFTVMVNGGPTGTVSVPVTVVIGPKNTAPTLKVSVSKANAATGVVTGKAAATDADKDTPTYTAPPFSAKGGVVEVNAVTGAFTYTPSVEARHEASVASAPSSAKTDTFTLNVSDGFGGVVNKVVTVAIAPKNAAPTVATNPMVGSPDSTTGVLTGTLAVVDDDGDPVTYYALPKKGAITFGTGGSFIYTPTEAARHAAAAVGAKTSVKVDTFSVTVNDGHGGTVVKTLTVPITPSNTGPAITSSTVTTPNSKTGVATGKIAATDADQDKLVFSGTSTAKGKVVVNAKTGTFTYTPTAAARHAASAATASPQDLKDSITLSVSDGHGGIATKTVEVAILAANKAPKVTATVGKPNTTTGVVTGTIKATDADKDMLTYVAPAATAKGTVIANPTTGAFTYTPSTAARHAASMTGAPKAVKQDSFTVTVTDGHGGSMTKLVTVAIAPANTAPALAGTPTVNSPNPNTGIVTGTLGATDADGDALAFKASPKKGTITFDAGGSFTYTPTTAARTAAVKPNASISAKQETFTVTVTDGFGGTTTKSVTVAIAPAGHVNSAPTMVTVAIDDEDPVTGRVAGKVTVTDPDGDLVTFEGPVHSAGGGTVSIRPDGFFTYIPAASQRHAAAADNAPITATTDLFIVTVTDGHGGTHSTTVTVAVAPANNAPTTAVGSPAYVVNAIDIATGAVTGHLNITDPDGDALIFSVPATTNYGGTVDVDAATGAFLYTPRAVQRITANADSTDTFVVTADDGHGGLISETITVPVASPESNTVVATIPVGPYPTDAATSPDGSYVYVVGGTDSGTVSVIDTATQTVTASIPVDAGAAGIVIAPDGSRVYVMNTVQGAASVSVVDTATNAVIAVIPVTNGSASDWPTGLAISPDGSRIYVTIDTGGFVGGKVSVINTATNKVIATIQQTGHPEGNQPTGVAVSADGSLVYVTNANNWGSTSGTVTVIDTATNSVSTTIPLGTYGPGALAVAPNGGSLYVVNESGGSVSVIDAATNAVTATIPVAEGYVALYGLTISPDGSRL